MKRDDINYLMVGLFTLGAFAALLIVLFRITGRDVSAEKYYALFDQVSGIRSGTAVTYGGYRIGQVTAINAQRRSAGTRYQLTMALRADWQIPEDSVAAIIAPGLLADKVVDIQEGSSQQLLKPGGSLNGVDPQDIFTILNRVALEMEDLSRNGIRPLLDSLNTHAERLATEVGEQLGRVTAEVERLLGNLNSSASELNKLVNPDNRVRVVSMLQQSERVMSNLARLTGEFQGVGNRLEILLDESKALVTENRTDLREMMETLRDALGTVSQNIDSIVHNLESTSRNLNEFSREIRHNPGRLLGGESPADQVTE